MRGDAGPKGRRGRSKQHKPRQQGKPRSSLGAAIVLGVTLATLAASAAAQEGEAPSSLPEDETTPDAGRTAAGEDGAEERSEAVAEEEEEEAGEEGEAVREGQAAGLQEPGLLVRYRPPPPPPQDDAFNLILPPFLYNRQGGVETVALFPLFHYRNAKATQGSPASEELLVPFYYWARSESDWDFLLPLFLWHRGPGHHTWMIPPVYSHSAPDGHDFGIAPLLMFGRHNTRHYTLIPPLLTLDWGVDDEERFTFSALFWRIQERYTEHWGVFPFLWVENSDSGGYTLAPPFFFQVRDADEGTTLTVIPPVYHRDEPDGSYFGVAPLFHHSSGTDWTSTTIFPLLTHYSEEPGVSRLTIGGLFWWWQDHGDETIVTPLYQRFRGATEMDAVAPFVFSIRDPRDGSSSLFVPPLFWHTENPASVNTVLFPFFGRFEERGRSETWITPLVGNHINQENGDETTWVLPTLQVSRWHDGDAVNIHPIWYYESVPSHRHAVFFPLYFDFEEFEGDKNRYTVLFPFLWRFREGITTSSLVFNVYHRERKREEGRSDWEFHFFPLFSFGEHSRGGHWWKAFYGLVGYERKGPYGFTTLFYVPFQTDGPPAND